MKPKPPPPLNPRPPKTCLEPHIRQNFETPDEPWAQMNSHEPLTNTPIEPPFKGKPSAEVSFCRIHRAKPREELGRPKGSGSFVWPEPATFVGFRV